MVFEGFVENENGSVEEGFDNSLGVKIFYEARRRIVSQA
jgi:hypothetical protein